MNLDVQLSESRITTDFTDDFEYLASGMTVAEILHDFPELTETDIRACFAYAADKEKSQVVVYTDEASIRSEHC